MGRKSSAKNKMRSEVMEKEKEAYDLVKKAQAIVNPLSDFLAFQTFKRNGVEAVLSFVKVEDVDAATLDWILKLEKTNMEAIYDSCSWGWSDSKKRKEMTEPEARYLIARVHGNPVAFSHLRFDLDYGDPVLYCYELQVDESMRRKGLGKFMLQVMELMAFKNNMKKVILTVLKHNQPAKNLFHSLKYTEDETSPVEDIYEQIPYEILSKINKKFVETVK